MAGSSRGHPAFEFDIKITEFPLDETPRENWATWIGIISTIIPGMIVSGFMPDWNVLPYNGWLTIAAIGSAIAGAIATPKFVRGAFSGMIAGVGMMFGLWLYVVIRTTLTGHHTFLRIELVLGGMLGAAPGLLLYGAWAREAPRVSAEEASPSAE